MLFNDLKDKTAAQDVATNRGVIGAILLIGEEMSWRISGTKFVTTRRARKVGERRKRKYESAIQFQKVGFRENE